MWFEKKKKLDPVPFVIFFFGKWVTDEKYQIIQQDRQAVTSVMKLVQTICLILSCFFPPLVIVL